MLLNDHFTNAIIRKIKRLNLSSTTELMLERKNKMINLKHRRLYFLTK